MFDIRTHCRVTNSGSAVLIELPAAEFGAFDELRVANLADELRQIAGKFCLPLVILDLEPVRHAGAAFLGMLARFAGQLRLSGRRLLVWGDRFRLLAASGMDSVVSVLDDAPVCASSTSITRIENSFRNR